MTRKNSAGTIIAVVLAFLFFVVGYTINLVGRR